MRILKKKGCQTGKENLKIMSVSVHACNPQLHKDKHVVSRNILPLEFISNEKKITIINNNKKSKTK